MSRCASGVAHLPSAFLIDADGVIQSQRVGPLSPVLLRALLLTIGVEWAR